MDQDADIRFRVKHDVPVFNRPFSCIATEFSEAQQRRVNVGEVTHARAMNVKNKVDGRTIPCGSARMALLAATASSAILPFASKTPFAFGVTIIRTKIAGKKTKGSCGLFG
jgi:hypothetical protein